MSPRDRLDEAFRVVFEPVQPTREEFVQHLETVIAPRELRQLELLPDKVLA